MGLQQALLIFRCDGTSQTGLGHVSRCLALAEAFQELGFRGHFVGAFGEHARGLIQSAGFSFENGFVLNNLAEDFLNLRRIIASMGGVAAIIDSYNVDADYVAEINAHAAPVLLIDDFSRLAYYGCTAVLNFTVNAPNLGYPRESTCCLLGPSFLLVRSRLRSLRKTLKRNYFTLKRVLVAIGGTDSTNLSSRVVKTLGAVAPGLCVNAVVGPRFGFRDELNSLLSVFPGGGRALVLYRDLADEFRQADVCITGGGLTKYESSYLGIPTAVVSQNADQQQETAQFSAYGLAVDLGLGVEVSDEQLQHRLAALLSDEATRERSGLKGLSVFPDDPTLCAAQAFREVLDNR